MPIGEAGTVRAAVEGRIVQDRLLARLSIAFGLVAVLLVAVGLYGVLSYGVARRTSEIGVRKALGATDGGLVALVLRETGGLVVVGLLAGAGLAAAAVQLIASRLYGLSPADPTAFAAAGLGLVAVAGLAAWVPAWRAARVDPVIALRDE
jgi:putative ABC transport system permease protein